VTRRLMGPRGDYFLSAKTLREMRRADFQDRHPNGRPCKDQLCCYSPRKKHRSPAKKAVVKYISVNRGVIDSNRKRGTNKPPIRVSWGKYGKKRYAHAVIVFGPSTFKYEPKNPLPHGARLWVETKATVGLRIQR
jgi:hypothetical protein